MISIIIFNIFFIKIVIGLVGNKSDKFEIEQVDDEEGEKFAKEIGSIFKNTSALEGVGIDELFENISYKILDPTYNFENKIKKNENLLSKINSFKLVPNKNKDKDKDKESYSYLDFNKCCYNT